MSTADELISYMEHRGWEPAILVNDDYVLELNEVHGRISAGFVLWRRLPNDEPELVVSGHATNGALWGAENQPLDLDDETIEVLSRLLRNGQRAQ